MAQNIPNGFERDAMAHQTERMSMSKGVGAVFTLRLNPSSLKASGDQGMETGAIVEWLMRGFDANEELTCWCLRASAVQVVYDGLSN